MAYLISALASVACHASPTPEASNTAKTDQPHIAASDTGRLITFSPGPIRAVVLVDSAFVEVGTMTRYIYHIAVRHDSTVDTLPNITTVARPTLVADSLVLGVAYDSNSAAGYSLFRYSGRTGRLQIIETLPDLRLAVSEPAFAPDGRYLAFIAFPGDETGRGTVVRWPSRELVLQTPSDTVPATDVTSGWGHWIDASHFELYMVIGDGTWVRFRGAVDPPSFVTDTVAPPSTH